MKTIIMNEKLSDAYDRTKNLLHKMARVIEHCRETQGVYKLKIEESYWLFVLAKYVEQSLFQGIHFKIVVQKQDFTVIPMMMMQALQHSGLISIHFVMPCSYELFVAVRDYVTNNKKITTDIIIGADSKIYAPVRKIICDRTNYNPKEDNAILVAPAQQFTIKSFQEVQQYFQSQARANLSRSGRMMSPRIFFIHSNNDLEVISCALKANVFVDREMTFLMHDSVHDIYRFIAPLRIVVPSIVANISGLNISNSLYFSQKVWRNLFNDDQRVLFRATHNQTTTTHVKTRLEERARKFLASFNDMPLEIIKLVVYYLYGKRITEQYYVHWKRHELKKKVTHETNIQAKINQGRNDSVPLFCDKYYYIPFFIACFFILIDIVYFIDSKVATALNIFFNCSATTLLSVSLLVIALCILFLLTNILSAIRAPAEHKPATAAELNGPEVVQSDQKHGLDCANFCSLFSFDSQ